MEADDWSEGIPTPGSADSRAVSGTRTPEKPALPSGGASPVDAPLHTLGAEAHEASVLRAYFSVPCRSHQPPGAITHRAVKINIKYRAPVSHFPHLKCPLPHAASGYRMCPRDRPFPSAQHARSVGGAAARSRPTESAAEEAGSLESGRFLSERGNAISEHGQIAR